MAGSYNHAVNGEGKLRAPGASFTNLVENGGDAYETVEEMFGMIWYLAGGDPAKVEAARLAYGDGIEMSPGIETEAEHQAYMRRTYPEQFSSR